VVEDEYVDTVGRPDARLRGGVDSERGVPVRFLYQLEYRVEHADAPDEWVSVARFDHNTNPDEGGHNVAVEGLHMDLYRDGEKYQVVRGFPPIPLNDAPDYAETYIRDHANRLIRRFEKWHDLNPTD
jgi:hypothetical protein